MYRIKTLTQNHEMAFTPGESLTEHRRMVIEFAGMWASMNSYPSDVYVNEKLWVRVWADGEIENLGPVD